MQKRKFRRLHNRLLNGELKQANYYRFSNFFRRLRSRLLPEGGKLKQTNYLFILRKLREKSYKAPHTTEGGELNQTN